MGPNERPRTSVIVPARNAGKTLAQALDSLLAQRDHDWQALIIDDNSTDDTAELIQRYAQRDARFSGLKGPGAGASAARNVGLSQAGGQRLLFLDSDDWVDARFLELMNAAIDAEPGTVAAYCNYRRVMPDGGQTPPRSSPHIAQAPYEAFARSCAAAIHSVVIDRALVSRIGGFDTSLQTCEDWDLWQRAARMGGNWVHVDQALSYYRTNAASLTQDIDRMLIDARTVIARGFAPDRRLASVPPRHLGGASSAGGRTAELAHAYFALWCAAFDCGRGGTGAAALEHLGALPPTPDAAQPIVDVLFDGVMVGLRTVPNQIALRWPAFGTGVTALVAQLGRNWNDPVAARRIQYRFEKLVLDYDDLAAPRRMTLTLGLRVDLRHPSAVTPPPGIDRLYVYLCDGQEVCALIDVGAIGTVTTRDWIDLAVARLGDAKVTATATLRLGPRLRRLKLAKAIREFVGPAARHIIWGGAASRRTEPAVTETHSPVPVLLYHRVASDGPAALSRYRVSTEMFRAQMRWLRRNDYHAITSDKLARFLARQQPLVGRPVVITFDDGFQDFADAAWPVLRSHDLNAEVFIVTDLVGKASTWDRHLGNPAPLMDSRTIARLASEGASFGSHLASHRAADGLSTREVTEELTRSRATLQRWLARPIESLAAPFGLLDGRLRLLAAQCGYRIVFGTHEGAVRLQSDPFDLPRIEVQGDWTLDTFIARLEACR